MQLLDAIIIDRLTRLGYRGDGRDRAFDRFATLYTYTERVIPQVPYRVRYRGRDFNRLSGVMAVSSLVNGHRRRK